MSEPSLIADCPDTLTATYSDTIGESKTLVPQHTGSLKVLFVMDKLGYAGGVSHGPAHYLRNVLPRFDHELVKPYLCVLSPWHPYADQLKAVGIHPVFLNRGKWDFRGLFDLVKVIRKHNIQIVQLFGIKSRIVGGFAARITGARIIIHVREMNPMDWLVRFIQRRLARWTVLALAVSQSVRSFTIEELGVGPDRVEVLHNPVVIEEFSCPSSFTRHQKRFEFDIAEHAKVVAIIGRLSPEKGHAFLIRAMPILLGRCPNTVLLIVGDGSTRQECEELGKELHLERSIRFAGNRDDVAQVLTAVDVVAMPSIREGLSLAALEASAAGKPIVATRVGGLPEVVIDGMTGFLVDLNDQEGFVDRLCQLLSDPECYRELSEGCRVHAQQFGVDKHLNHLIAKYRSLELVANKS